MNAREASQEFARATNRLFRVSGHTTLGFLPERGVQFRVDQIETYEEFTKEKQIILIRVEMTHDPEITRAAEFESTAEEETDVPSLPASPKQLTQGET